MDLILEIRAYEGYIGWIHENFCIPHSRIKNPMRVGDATEKYRDELLSYIDSVVERCIK